jgi:mRNA turnover protein 4
VTFLPSSLFPVSLTKTKQDRRGNKSKLIDSIRAAAEQFSSAYVFSMENVRSERFKELRAEWSDSRFFLGKNRLMALALGETPEAAHRPALDELAADVHGDVGLLFTDRAHKAVASFFASYGTADYARAGFMPEASVRVEAGRLETLPHTMLDQLRKLGMPVRLDKGVLVLPQAYSLCTAGKALTPEQGRLLKYFGHQLAVFKMQLVSSVRAGVYKSLLTPEAKLKRSVYTKKEKRPSGRREKRSAAAGEEGGDEEEDQDAEEDEDGEEDDEEMDDEDDE